MSHSRDEENGIENNQDETAARPDGSVPEEASGNGEDLGTKVASLEDELGQYKDRYMRAVAEMENVRRRSEKERLDLSKYALEGMCRDLLPVLDSFEQAIGADNTEAETDKSFYSGMVMVKKQLLDVLRKHGLEQISAKDQPFDPNFHQAIQRVESAEHKEETVAGEFQKGYVLNGRLIRPAMVSVFIPV